MGGLDIRVSFCQNAEVQEDVVLTESESAHLASILGEGAEAEITEPVQPVAIA